MATQKAAAATTTGGSHVEKDGSQIAINIPDHPDRKESSAFSASKKLAKKILATIPGGVYGTENVQMHHGGSLWGFDGTTWHLYLNTLGMEWSSQFCADPVKIDKLRVNAKAFYDNWTKTVPEMVRLGYKNAQQILDTPITDAAGIALWVDSIFNSCVPLPAPVHTGALPHGSGEHHYPRPITNIGFFHRDDFVLWHTDPDSGTPVAVVPTSHPGTTDKPTVQVVYAQAGTALHKKMTASHAKGQIHELGPRHALTKAALAGTTAPATKP